jgi:serine/threonine-protein kinase
MATVWRARDLRLGRDVAVKELSAGLAQDPEYMVRFFSEAQSIARISNPHVIGILDFGEHDEHPYLVMDLVQGGSAADLMGEPILPERATEIVREAASAAGAAHAHDIVHRDIKPANILLAPDGRVRLADFGIATSAGAEKMTATGQAIGSPHYISPEQVAGQSATPASDVYALGIVLYELLTGRKPFDGTSVTQIAISHVDRVPDPPSTHVPDLDPELERLVMKALAKEPSDRFEDGAQLAAALASIDEGVSFADDDAADAPVPAWRRPGLIGAAALSLVALLAAGVLALGGFEDPTASAEAETQDTEAPRKRAKPKPTASAPVAVQTSPTPSPTATDARKKRAGDGSTSGSGDSETEEPVEEPVEPEPTSEPTPTPEPEPTETPASEEGTASGEGANAGSADTGGAVGAES